jgi:hypothetical protein
MFLEKDDDNAHVVSAATKPLQVSGKASVAHLLAYRFEGLTSLQPLAHKVNSLQQSQARRNGCNDKGRLSA